MTRLLDKAGWRTLSSSMLVQPPLCLPCLCAHRMHHDHGTRPRLHVRLLLFQLVASDMTAQITHSSSRIIKMMTVAAPIGRRTGRLPAGDKKLPDMKTFTWGAASCQEIHYPAWIKSQKMMLAPSQTTWALPPCQSGMPAKSEHTWRPPSYISSFWTERLYVHAYVCVCVCVYVCMCMPAFMYACVCACACMHACLHMCVCVFVHVRAFPWLNQSCLQHMHLSVVKSYATTHTQKSTNVRHLWLNHLYNFSGAYCQTKSTK